MYTRLLSIGTALSISCGLASAQSPDRPQDHERSFEIGTPEGLVTLNDGSFNYQGYLEVDGQPANGMYSFRFEAFEDAVGSDILSELVFESPPVQVVDGLFFVNVQMGGTPSEARRFWREVGNEEMYLEIGVGEIEGGPYTTLGTRTRVGWSARAQYAGIAESLRFPYSDSYTNEQGSASTMLSLTSEFGGIVAQFRSNEVRDEPLVYIRGERVYSPTFGFQSGALLVDSMEDEVAIRGEGSRFSVVGFHSDPFTLPGVGAAILGSVGFSSSPNVVAVWASNSASGNSAFLGSENYAGDFVGDVLARENLRVDGEAVRDFGNNEVSPIGPIAYGFVTASGAVSGATANLSATWNASSSQYQVSVNGETITLGPYTAVVTVVDSNEPRLATTNTVAGDLIVKVWDLNSGNIAVQDNFQVVIYKADPNAFLVRGAPNGVDPDKYYEQTGTVPIIGTTTTPMPVSPPASPRLD